MTFFGNAFSATSKGDPVSRQSGDWRSAPRDLSRSCQPVGEWDEISHLRPPGTCPSGDPVQTGDYQSPLLPAVRLLRSRQQRYWTVSVSEMPHGPSTPNQRPIDLSSRDSRESTSHRDVQSRGKSSQALRPRRWRRREYGRVRPRSWGSICPLGRARCLDFIRQIRFFFGRLVSYSIYVTVATLADKQLGNVLGQIFGSPWSIALQIVLLVAVCGLPFVNWRQVLNQSSGT